MASDRMIGSQRHIDISQPRFDQRTFDGRARHFFIVTNPLNVFVSGAKLDEAAQVIKKYKFTHDHLDLTENELWKAKNLYDSAFHPESGEKMFILGRMSCQVPMNMVITGCMLAFYKTTLSVIFWQWFNQSFNAIVNHTNRSSDAAMSNKNLGMSYALATTAATGTGLTLKSVVSSFPPIVARYVPFGAVAAANCINIPFMRSSELSEGIPVRTSDDKEVGKSKKAARKAIVQVLISRICMAAPAMMIPPLIMNRVEKKGLLKRYPLINAPLQVALVGFFLVFATPLCCAIFPQKSSIALSSLEPEIQQAAQEMDIKEKHLHYSKGL